MWNKYIVNSHSDTFSGWFLFGIVIQIYALPLANLELHTPQLDILGPSTRYEKYLVAVAAGISESLEASPHYPVYRQVSPFQPHYCYPIYIIGTRNPPSSPLDLRNFIDPPKYLELRPPVLLTPDTWEYYGYKLSRGGGGGVLEREHI